MVLRHLCLHLKCKKILWQLRDQQSTYSQIWIHSKSMDSNDNLFASYWKGLTEGIAQKEVTLKWQEEISTKYREPQRYYHTLQHILDMKGIKDKFQQKLQFPKLVDFAIIFHDVIYQPQKGDNEEESARLFCDFAKEIHLPESDVGRVNDWILLTKHHTTPEHKQQSNNIGDHHYLLDFDMAILGASQQVYKEYARNIRKEYCHVPYNEYCTKRAQVLKSFLTTPRIYATQDLYDLYETQARINVEEEIADLLQAINIEDG